MKKDGFEIVEAASREAWRRWLKNNHDKSSSVWLVIYHKSSEVSSVTYHEAVEEALCFGWIDSKPNKRDAQSYYQFFAPRNAKSNWSRRNKEIIEKLSQAGKMAPAGIKMVELAKENGTWNALDDVENLVIPADLDAELRKYPKALIHWEAFPRSVKRGILEWIQNAKRPATRTRRIEETARLAAENKRANQYRN